MKEKTDNIDILEELANNEHIRWSNWQKYVHSKCIKNDDGSLTIPKEYVEHWEYEINTDYANLPENIKESDRREVRQILEKLNYSTLIAENKELKDSNVELATTIDCLQTDLKEIKEEYSAEQKHEMENTIPKSKIGEIMEEFKEVCSYMDKSDNLSKAQISILKKVIKRLQEILGKEKK